MAVNRKTTYDDLKSKMKSLTSDGGVCKSLIQAGDGKGKLPKDATVWLHYSLYTEGKNKAIDSTRNREILGTYKLGNGEMILGMEIAVRSMEVGELAKFILDSEYAYGKLGCPELIPPNSRIFLAIEIVKFSMEEVKKPVYDMTSDERTELSFEEMYKAADELREVGNRKYTFKRYSEAIDRYENAIEILEEAFVLYKAEDVMRTELKFKLFSNLSICHLYLGEAEEALAAGKSALLPGMPKPTNSKVYFRCALACVRLNKLEDALEYCALAIELDPDNFELVMLERRIKKKIQEHFEGTKELYQKMGKLVVAGK